MRLMLAAVVALVIVAPTRTSAQSDVRMVASLVMTEGAVRVDGRPVESLSGPLVLSDRAVLVTAQGRAAIALKRGGGLFLDQNSSVRVLDYGAYNFNRIEILTGSAIVSSGSSSPIVECENDMRLSDAGIFRLDVEPHASTGERYCRFRVFEGAASVQLKTVTNALRAGQTMTCNLRCGDMIPTSEFSRDELDAFDQWARRAYERVRLAGASNQAAGQSPATSSAVTGTWRVTMVNRAEPLKLELSVDGSSVTGTFDGSAVVGEYKNGQLVFAGAASFAAWRAGTIGGDDAPVMYPTVVTARINEAGSLTGWTDVYIRGYGPQPIKRMTWTAVRVPSK
jgi:hypothetical protein